MEDVAAPEREPFEVDLPVFSGPFRLLAGLILDQKVDVCDVARGAASPTPSSSAG